jgi:hypothetical protein
MNIKKLGGVADAVSKALHHVLVDFSHFLMGGVSS